MWGKGCGVAKSQAPREEQEAGSGCWGWEGAGCGEDRQRSTASISSSDFILNVMEGFKPVSGISCTFSKKHSACCFVRGW